MEATTRQGMVLAEYDTSLSGVVLLIWSAGTFCTEQEFAGGETTSIEVPSPLEAFLCYEYARENGRVRAPFPVPVHDDEPDPPDEGAPALPLAAERREIRRSAGVSQRRLAAEIGISHHTLSAWEHAGVIERSGRTADHCAKFRRYLEEIAAMKGGVFKSTMTPDGPRRCAHPGCGAILSRYNDGDRCACHA